MVQMTHLQALPVARLDLRARKRVVMILQIRRMIVRIVIVIATRRRRDLSQRNGGFFWWPKSNFSDHCAMVEEKAVNLA
jgi:hypothetical protein